MVQQIDFDQIRKWTKIIQKNQKKTISLVIAIKMNIYDDQSKI